MKLQRLELFGFKSFADRVSVRFDAGVTAIVGPNGCGKSNICDAIRWVLGEQRPTLIRGSKMDEVIFAGTRERKPINMAEVSLYFSNDDGALPVPYSEVSISRRIYRESESDYLINKQICRLKDVQDLFLGTGVGTHAYSLIQQGMIDAVLSDKTEERRYLFEEAAGVTRYKTRRKAAERKLEATTQDLVRVEDIVAEVEKTVTGLRRQMGKARRFREYEEQERRLDVHVTGREIASLAERRAPLEEELRTLESAEAEHAARLAGREAELETLELDLVQGRAEEQAYRARLEDLRTRITRREQTRLVTGETLAHHARRLEALAAEDDRAAERAEELRARRDTLETERASAAERLSKIAVRLDPEGDLGLEEADLAERKAERARLAREVEGLRERHAEARQTAARRQSAAEAAAERHAALAAEHEAQERARAAAAGESSAARAALESASEAHEEASRLADQRRASLKDTLAERDATRERLAAARAAEQAAATRRETLAAMESRLEGYGSGARALLTGEEPVEGILGALTQSVEAAEARFERALDGYLESLGHALLARDRDAASEGAGRLAETGTGRADFLVPELMAGGDGPEIPDGAAAVLLARGTDAVRWTGDERVAPRVRPLFARLLVVDDLAAAFRCRAALLEDGAAARHYVVASLDGSLIEPTGRWRPAGDENQDGLLARRRLLAEAEAELAEACAATARLEAAFVAIEEAAGSAEAELAEVVERQRTADEARRQAREARAVADEIATRVAGRVTELAAAVGEQVEARETAHAARAAAGETLAEIERDLANARERLADVQSALDRYDEVREERLSARHAVEIERTEAEAAVRAVEREIAHLDAAEETATQAREDRAVERARLEEASARLEEEREAGARELEQLHAELEEAESGGRDTERRFQEMEERRGKAESEIRGWRRSHDEAVERRHQVTLALQDLGFRREALENHVAQTYEGKLADLAARHPLTDEEAALALDELQRRLDEVRRKRANLGPVNMLAMEEHDREAERLVFLQTQRDDLVQARRQLEEAIRRINDTARTLFLETFDQIRTHFNETFQVLFEGGNADIHLADPDDPLESPVEIVASPRGKRVQHITLLSGGERALTALSLLFAIYRVKPSPFCILDEVDAPLDDANIARFLKMIRHFSDRTQFIVITHNKRTMEAADYLYGITMEEPGVSSVVSVALAEEEHGLGEPEEAAAWAVASTG